MGLGARGRDAGHGPAHRGRARRAAPDRIADLAHTQAEVRLTPHPHQPVTATIAAMLQHHAAIEHERAGREGLLSTIGKEWILGLSPSSGSGWQ